MDNFSFYPTERTAVFIDGSNLYSAARALGFDIDYKKLHALLKNKCHLVRMYYYTALHDSDSEYSPIRPLVDWLDYNGYTMVTKATKTFVDSSGKVKVKGNMDIEIVVDVMNLVHAKAVDHVVLCSGDGDFRRLLESIQALGIRCTVISTIVSQPPMVADELRRQADTFIDLSKIRDLIIRDSNYGYTHQSQETVIDNSHLDKYGLKESFAEEGNTSNKSADNIQPKKLSSEQIAKAIENLKDPSKAKLRYDSNTGLTHIDSEQQSSDVDMSKFPRAAAALRLDGSIKASVQEEIKETKVITEAVVVGKETSSAEVYKVPEVTTIQNDKFYMTVDARKRNVEWAEVKILGIANNNKIQVELCGTKKFVAPNRIYVYDVYTNSYDPVTLEAIDEHIMSR